jgi:hypothetical protein
MNKYVSVATTTHGRVTTLDSLYTQPLTVDLQWNTADPLVVTLVTDPDGHPVTWIIAREMLAMGMQTAITPKHGDVAVLPRTPGFPKTMMVILKAGAQQAGIILDRVDIAMFLQRTFETVPLGKERIDLDAALAQLLDEEAAS